VRVHPLSVPVPPFSSTSSLSFLSVPPFSLFKQARDYRECCKPQLVLLIPCRNLPKILRILTYCYKWNFRKNSSHCEPTRSAFCEGPDPGTLIGSTPMCTCIAIYRGLYKHTETAPSLTIKPYRILHIWAVYTYAALVKKQKAFLSSQRNSAQRSVCVNGQMYLDNYGVICQYSIVLFG